MGTLPPSGMEQGGIASEAGQARSILCGVLCIAVLGYASFLGVSNTYGDLTRVYVKGAGDIQLGMDLRGGVEVVFGPPEGVDATEAERAWRRPYWNVGCCPRTSRMVKYTPILTRPESLSATRRM